MCPEPKPISTTSPSSPAQTRCRERVDRLQAAGDVDDARGELDRRRCPWVPPLRRSTGKPGQVASLRGYPGAVPKRRLDSLLAERGLFPSRSRAAAAVLAGEVRIGGEGGGPPSRGSSCATTCAIELDGPPRFVSRGGIKLANALTSLRRRPGRAALPRCGRPTGGFTDCLLQRGADGGGSAGRRLRRARLAAAPGPARDGDRAPERPRICGRTRCRSGPTWWSWTSRSSRLARSCPAVLACVAPEFDCLALVKPQFEVGREQVGKGGVVRDAGRAPWRAGALSARWRATAGRWRCWDSRRRAFRARR